MKKITISILLIACLSSSGCFTRWRQAKIVYPVIPVQEYPSYKIPAKIETEQEKQQVVTALFEAEKYAQELKAKVEVYNDFAKGKNANAKEIFK